MQAVPDFALFLFGLAGASYSLVCVCVFISVQTGRPTGLPIKQLGLYT
jgi:hypothetical protein